MVSTVLIMTSWILALCCAFPILVNAKLETFKLPENESEILGLVKCCWNISRDWSKFLACRIKYRSYCMEHWDMENGRLIYRNSVGAGNFVR